MATSHFRYTCTTLLLVYSYSSLLLDWFFLMYLTLIIQIEDFLIFFNCTAQHQTVTHINMIIYTRCILNVQPCDVLSWTNLFTASSLTDLRRWSALLKTAMCFLCFTSHSSSLSHTLIQTSRSSGCVWTLRQCFRFRASLLPLSSSLSSQFSTSLMLQQWDRSHHYSTGYNKLT